MYKYAQIYDNKVHCIMEHEQPITVLRAKYFSADIVLVDITIETDVKEGWGYINSKFIEPTPTVLTTEEIQKNLINAVQNHMDDKAKVRGYDSLLTVVTYAEESSIPVFQSEGIVFREWRSQVWAYCYSALADVMSGNRAIPTSAELISELPTFNL